MQLNNLQDVLMEQLADLYSAETQLVAALPQLAGAAHSTELREAFTHHLEQTRNHVQRLDEAFNELSAPRSSEMCQAMRGLIQEGDDVVHATGDPNAIDAALIAAAQRVEHYEISAYGTARALASQLGYERTASLLDETRVQVERLNQAFTLVGLQADTERCKGMAGLIEEGESVIEDGAEATDEAAADLALIAAAQKVEHYEISAYGTARALATQIGLPLVAQILSQSLAEEEIADSWLTEVARELMTQSRTGEVKTRAKRVEHREAPKSRSKAPKR